MARDYDGEIQEFIDENALKSRLTETTDRLAGMTDLLQSSWTTETERVRALEAEQASTAKEVAALKATLYNVASMTRRPSKAHLLGKPDPQSPFATDGGYLNPERSGMFLKAIMQAGSREAHLQAEGRAYLESVTRYDENIGKATLGSTDATGGYIVPNSIVDDLVKVGQFNNVYNQIMTVRRGVNAPSVDIPFRGAAPTAAVVISRGSTKTNANLAYDNYTATMYTIAVIHDLAKQFVRQSAGAAEQDAFTELAHAIALGEANYIRSGTGSGEPYGIATAVTAAPFSPSITTSHSPTAATVAGSVAAAIAKASGALLARNRRPTAAVLSASGYTELVTTGTDTAGFFISGLGAGADSPFAPGTLVSPWGIPVYVDPGMATDDLWVGDFKQFVIYEGESFRVDTSDEAGDRWDKNLVGFRGEMDFAFDARPAVYAGCLQVVADILS